MPVRQEEPPLPGASTSPSLRFPSASPLGVNGELNLRHRVRPGQRDQHRKVPAFVLQKGRNFHFPAELKGRTRGKILNVAASGNEIAVDVRRAIFQLQRA